VMRLGRIIRYDSAELVTEGLNNSTMVHGPAITEHGSLDLKQELKKTNSTVHCWTASPQ
jgi:hypothetical protein